MKYIAHTHPSGEEQLLADHLQQVAQLASEYATAFHAGPLGYLSGLLHDLGKYKRDFQDRIRGKPIRVTHSTAGAQTIIQEETIRLSLGHSGLHRELAHLIAFAIAFHHGGLRNYGSRDEDGSLASRLGSPEDNQLWAAAWSEITLPQNTISLDLPAFRNLNNDRLSWKLSFLGRMLYSCLVDADSVDTRDFLDPKLKKTLVPWPSIEELLRRLNAYLDNRFSHVGNTTVNRKRAEIRASCERQAELDRGLFALTVPTGGGKTLSSLSFALRHAQKHGMRRVIYVIPFTSIIEQNAEQFRNAIGQDAIIEHHSNFNREEYEEENGTEEGLRQKLGAENWEAPVIVTTSVQFFESLFANKRSKCRKLHNIADSVIILDEAQSLPRGYLEPCLRALEELTESYGCSVVLCTATQPSWSGLGRQVTELMDAPKPAELFQAFKRVTVHLRGSSEEAVTDAELADSILQDSQALCIVNTRKHAKLLLDQLPTDLEGLYLLSGRLFPKHRSNILLTIRSRLGNELPCRVISTQLIEAGVDVDFPVAYRALAGLDSIAQAAGRCNREGKLPTGHLTVFHPEPHGMPSKGWLKETAVEADHCLRLFGADQALSLDCVNEYFERVHGLRDEEYRRVLLDQEELVKLLSVRPPQYPYEEIDRRFRFIDSEMESVVVPWLVPETEEYPGNQRDEWVADKIDALDNHPYPSVLLRQLQSHTVQVYRHELKAYLERGVIRSAGGVWVLEDLSYYHPRAGLLAASDAPEPGNYIF